MRLRIVVTGAGGQLGSYVLDRLETTGHEALGWSRAPARPRSRAPIEPVDLTDPSATRAAIERADPDAILHLAAVSRVEDAFRDPDRARAVNADATGLLADWAAARGRRLVATSTDLVFDGSRPFRREDDPAEPVLTYGRSKREGERLVLRHDRHLVVRLALLYGPSRCGRPTFLDGIFTALARREPRRLFLDEYRTPLDYATAADALIRLVERPAITGLLHLGGPERLSRFTMVRRLAAHAGLPLDPILGVPSADVPAPEPRPADVSLDTTRLRALLPDLDLPSLEAGLDRCTPGRLPA